MANVKISELPSLSTMTNAAEIPVVAGGTTQQITGANLKTFFTGNVGFVDDAIYDLNGVIVENADLSHGATASLIIPSNGNTAVPVQLNNTYGNITIGTGPSSTITSTWKFDTQGAINLPAPGTVRGDNVNMVSNGFVQMQWVDSGNINIADPNYTEGPTNWAYMDSGAFNIEVGVNTGAANVHGWYFTTNGNLTTNTGNLKTTSNVITTNSFVGPILRTNLSNFNWSANITNITTGATTVVTLANNIFGDPWDGQVTITDVGGATEANATWWYVAVDANAFQLYTDNTFTTPVDSSTWGAYTGGGFAVTLDYGNIQINAQTVTIQSGQADYNNRVWSFDSKGQTVLPVLTTVRGDVSGGTISGYTLNIGDGAQEAIITTPDAGTGQYNSQRLVINPGAGETGTSGEGGDIYLWAGRGGSSNGNGGDVKIRGGYGPGDGQGGYIRVEAGDVQGSGTPGYIYHRGGDVSVGTGGYIQSQGGQGTTGGYISLTGGYGTDGPGGAVTIAGGGAAGGLPYYGNVGISAGASSWAFDNAGTLTFPSLANISGGNFNAGTASATVALNAFSPDGNTVSFQAQGNSSNAVVQTYNNTSTTTQSWTFDNTGNLTVPGTIIGAQANVDLVAGVYTWTMDNTGVLKVPGEGIIQSLNDTVILQSKNTGTGNTYSARLGTTGGLYFETTEYPLGWLSITNNVGNANITAASGTAGAGGKNLYITAGAADQGDFYTTPGGSINITGGLGASNDGGGGGPGGNVNIAAGLSSDPAGVAGNVNITSGTKTWNFDNTGNLAFPSAGAFMKNVRTVSGGAVPSGFYPTYYNPTTKEFIVVTP